MTPSEPNETLPPAKIGGWLLVFLVFQYLGCLSLALQIFRADTTSRTLLLILMFAVTFLAAVLVGMRSQLVFSALWLQFATRLIVTAVNARLLWSTRKLNLPNHTHDVVNQLGGVLYVAIWLLYFHSSERVRKTFGQNL